MLSVKIRNVGDAQSEEISRILRAIADEIDDRKKTEGVVRDLSGNKLCLWEFDSEDD